MDNTQSNTFHDGPNCQRGELNTAGVFNNATNWDIHSKGTMTSNASVEDEKAVDSDLGANGRKRYHSEQLGKVQYDEEFDNATYAELAESDKENLFAKHSEMLQEQLARFGCVHELPTVATSSSTKQEVVSSWLDWDGKNEEEPDIVDKADEVDGDMTVIPNTSEQYQENWDQDTNQSANPSDNFYDQSEINVSERAFTVNRVSGKKVEFDKYFFQHMASRHGIRIERPQKNDIKNETVETLDAAFEVDSQVDESEDPTATNLYDYKFWTYRKGPKIDNLSEIGSGYSTDSELEMDSVKATERSKSVGSVDRLSTSTPEPSGEFACSGFIEFQQGVKKTATGSNLRPNAPEFISDSNSSFSEKLDSSFRVDAPEFVPAVKMKQMRPEATEFQPKEKSGKKKESSDVVGRDGKRTESRTLNMETSVRLDVIDTSYETKANSIERFDDMSDKADEMMWMDGPNDIVVEAPDDIFDEFIKNVNDVVDKSPTYWRKQRSGGIDIKVVQAVSMVDKGVMTDDELFPRKPDKDIESEVELMKEKMKGLQVQYSYCVGVFDPLSSTLNQYKIVLSHILHY